MTGTNKGLVYYIDEEWIRGFSRDLFRLGKKRFPSNFHIFKLISRGCEHRINQKIPVLLIFFFYGHTYFSKKKKHQ